MPAFDPERRSGAATDIDKTDGGTDDGTNMKVIATANGVCAYDHNSSDIGKSERPTHAAQQSSGNRVVTGSAMTHCVM